MIIPQDARFRREWEAYRLRFNCEDCSLFDPDRGACAHGYPTAGHRASRYDDPAADLLFCKDFDLV
ncbi:MAG: hypothetical protein ACOC97_06190 [Myxococcota bacterium]